MLVNRLISCSIACVLLLVMWVMYGWNSWNGDRDAYEMYFSRELLFSWGLEIGYGYLNLLAKDFNLDYQAFQILLSFFTLLLFCRYLLKTSVSPVFSLLVFGMVFFPIDYVLMRNFLSFVIILQGIIELLKGTFQGRLFFVLLVLLATTFHQSAIVFLIFYFVPVNGFFSLRKFFIFFSVIVLIYIPFRTSVALPSAIQSHFDMYAVTLQSAVYKIIVHVFFSLIAIFIARMHCLSIADNKYPNYLVKMSFFIFNMNLVSFFFVFLYFEAEIFIRVLRYVIFFNVFYCLNIVFFPKVNHLFVSAYVFLCVCFLFFYFIYPVMDLSLFPLFNRNIIFNSVV